jgi:thiol-disulfide isomerase/thioredoxin
MEIVYIGAEWCSTCKTIKPAIEELGKRFGVPVRCLDYETDLSEDEKDRITKVPTIRLSGPSAAAEFNVRQVAQTEAWLSANVTLHAAAGDADF